MSEMADAIRELTQEKGVSLDSVKQTIENSLKAAYKKAFGNADNCIVKLADDLSDVAVYSRKTIVDGVYDPLTEIELEDALKLSSECELGDEIDILIDPKKEFARSAVSTGKQTAHVELSERFKDKLYNEYKDKIGEIIIGFYQREYNGNIYVDLGGKIDGVLPQKYQSPREEYGKNDRIKALIVDLKKTGSGLQLVLSRTDPKFVQSLLELEIPEIYDKTIEIHKIVRDPGYRTKISVSSNKEDVDPVGACVGLKGVRIQNVIRELEGEKIDVLKYDSDPTVFIKNALSPAEVSRVVIMDASKKLALAIVPDSQFSLAIGKQGQNVRLANRLCDWNIDVKTEEQAADIDFSEIDSRKAAESLFNNDSAVEYEEISKVSELPNIPESVVSAIKGSAFDDIEAFFKAVDSGEINSLGISDDDIQIVKKEIDSIEVVDDASAPSRDAASVDVDQNEQESESEEEYFCPECGTRITLDMKKCPNPNCGCEFEFEEGEE